MAESVNETAESSPSWLAACEKDLFACKDTTCAVKDKHSRFISSSRL